MLTAGSELKTSKSPLGPSSISCSLLAPYEGLAARARLLRLLRQVQSRSSSNGGGGNRLDSWTEDLGKRLKEWVNRPAEGDPLMLEGRAEGGGSRSDLPDLELENDN